MCGGCCSAQSTFKHFKPIQQSRQQGIKTYCPIDSVAEIVMCDLGTISTQCQSQITKKSGKTWCGMPQEAIFHRPSNKVLQWVLLIGPLLVSLEFLSISGAPVGMWRGGGDVSTPSFGSHLTLDLIPTRGGGTVC